MYFNDCTNINEVKSLYRKLCFQHHPDIGGDPEIMKAINSEYHNKLRSFDGYTVTDEQGKGHTYYYNQAKEQEIMDKINELLHLKMKDVQILLVGFWVWIEGNTREYRDKLKDLKCRWHEKRKMWYWHGQTYKHRYSNKDFSYIIDAYGVKRFEHQEEKKDLVTV